jgi:hypothetical protein
MRRKLLYIAFLLLAGVSPAYDRHRRKKTDKSQLLKETSTPWEILKFEEENNR